MTAKSAGAAGTTEPSAAAGTTTQTTRERARATSGEHENADALAHGTPYCATSIGTAPPPTTPPPAASETLSESAAVSVATGGARYPTLMAVVAPTPPGA